MNSAGQKSEKDNRDGARVDHVPSEDGKQEDLPSDWVKEDSRIVGRKPDLGEIEEDASEL